MVEGLSAADPALSDPAAPSDPPGLAVVAVVGVDAAGLVVVARPGTALATRAVNSPATTSPPAATSRVVREMRLRPWSRLDGEGMGQACPRLLRPA